MVKYNRTHIDDYIINLLFLLLMICLITGNGLSLIKDVIFYFYI